MKMVFDWRIFYRLGLFNSDKNLIDEKTMKT